MEIETRQQDKLRPYGRIWRGELSEADLSLLSDAPPNWKDRGVETREGFSLMMDGMMR